MPRSNTLSQAHPVAPGAKYLSRSDPAPRFARGRRVVGLVVRAVMAAACVYVILVALLVSGPRP